MNQSGIVIGHKLNLAIRKLDGAKRIAAFCTTTVTDIICAVIKAWT